MLLRTKNKTGEFIFPALYVITEALKLYRSAGQFKKIGQSSQYAKSSLSQFKILFYINAPNLDIYLRTTNFPVELCVASLYDLTTTFFCLSKRNWRLLMKLDEWVASHLSGGTSPSNFATSGPLSFSELEILKYYVCLGNTTRGLCLVSVYSVYVHREGEIITAVWMMFMIFVITPVSVRPSKAYWSVMMRCDS